MPDWDAKVAAIRKLLAITGSDLPLLRSPTDEWIRHFGALALARSRRIILLALNAWEMGLPDVTGIGARPLYETWLTGLYAILGGPQAGEAIVRDARHYASVFNKEAGLDLPAIEEWAAKGRASLGVLTKAQRVAKLLKELDEPAADLPISAYHRLFRGESYLNAHGGLGSFAGYLTITPDGALGVLEEREETESAKGRLWFMGALFGLLAIDVYEAFGLDPDALYDAAQPLEFPGPNEHGHFSSGD